MKFTKLFPYIVSMQNKITLTINIDQGYELTKEEVKELLFNSNIGFKITHLSDVEEYRN